MARRVLEVAVSRTLDAVALRAFATELTALTATPGLRSSAGAFLSARGDRAPGELEPVEVALDRGDGRRSRVALARLRALPAEHRPVALWLAHKAPLGDGVDAWPLALAVAVGPAEAARAEQLARAEAELSKGRLNALRASGRRSLTHDVAVAIDRAKEQHDAARTRHELAVAELTLWGRDRLAAALRAWEQLRAHDHPAPAP
jgi:hypothetical protein